MERCLAEQDRIDYGNWRVTPHEVVEAGPCEVIGKNYQQYIGQGGPSGSLGYPITRPKASGDRMTQGFEGGDPLEGDAGEDAYGEG